MSACYTITLDAYGVITTQEEFNGQAFVENVEMMSWDDGFSHHDDEIQLGSYEFF